MEPKIRFKGFEEEWKAPLFSEMVERISASGQAGMLPGVEFEDIASGEGCFNKNIYQKECHKYGKLFYEGDILFGKLRPYLKNIILADFNGVAIGDFWVLRSKGFDEKYLYTLVNSESFLKVANISSGSKMPRADWNLVSTTKFVVPSAKDEQKAIGKYFTSLDSQISAATSRLASLKQMKAASLQAMFPQEGETVPKIRFKGFEGEWTWLKLGDISEQVKRKAPINSTAPVMMISALNGFINQSEKYSDNNAGSSLANYTLLKKGELSYNHGYSKTRNFGSCFNLLVEEARIPFVYHSFRLTNDNDSFYAYYLNSGTKDKDLKRLVSSTARMDGLLNISFKNYMELSVPHPSLAEQQAIANYFTSLDRQISLQSQRLEKLKQIKSACLDKMFV